MQNDPVPGGEAFYRFKEPEFRWGTRYGSFPSFQTTEISLGYQAGKLSIVSNNQNFIGVHEEEAFHRFKETKFRCRTRRGSFPSFQTTEISLGYTKRKLSIVSSKRNFVGVPGEKIYLVRVPQLPQNGHLIFYFIYFILFNFNHLISSVVGQGYPAEQLHLPD